MSGAIPLLPLGAFMTTSIFFSDRFVRERSVVLDIMHTFLIVYGAHRCITMHNKPCTKYVLLTNNIQNHHHVYATPDVFLE